MRRGLSFLALVLALLTACATSATSSTATPSPKASPTPVPTGPIAWATCDAQFQCATIKVPLDYTKPTGSKISLALIRLPATDPAHRIGSLLTNPGGPGESGKSFLIQAATVFFSPTLRARFDIVTWDPRGVGESTAVQCLDGPGLDTVLHYDPIADDPAEQDAQLQGFKTLIAGCQAHSASLLGHVSTRDSARDIEEIRKGLGEDKINYVGFSYGTFLGAMYAHLFPNHVRAWTLDGAVDPNLTYAQVAQTQSGSFEKNLNDFLGHCAALPTCAFYNGGGPAAALDAFLAKVDQTPIVLSDGRSMGRAEAITGVLASLYNPSDWDQLASSLQLAQAGNAGALMASSDSYWQRNFDGTYANILEANIAINCIDYAAPTTVADYQALASQLAAVSPHFGVAQAWSPCIYWPVAPDPPPGDLSSTGGPPILIVGGTSDPATPYTWAQSLNRQIPGSVLLTRVGDGHISYDKSACIRAAVDNYLVKVSPPVAGTTCS